MRLLALDDWLMLATLVQLVIISALVTWQSSLGGFRHLRDVPQERLSKVALLNYVMQDVGIFSYVTGKASVGFLILRFLGPKSIWRKWTIWTVMIFTLIVNSINCIITFAQCDPPRALWEHGVTAHCWNPQVQEGFAIFQSSENIAADVILALLPATIFWNLNLERKKKINLCILLGLGLFAAIAGIVKTSYLGELTSHSDLTWDTYDLVVWSGAEDFVIIFCGSIPPLKPFWDHYVTNQRTLTPSRHRATAYSMKRLDAAKPFSFYQSGRLDSETDKHNSEAKHIRLEDV